MLTKQCHVDTLTKRPLLRNNQPSHDGNNTSLTPMLHMTKKYVSYNHCSKKEKNGCFILHLYGLLNR